MLALLLLGPGILLRAILCRRRAVELPLAAAAFWVVAFWWLRLLPWRWDVPVLVLGAATLAAGGWLQRRAPPDRASALVWLVAAATVSVLAGSAILPPGVDGAMHTAVARVIADAGGRPTSFRPLWPLDFFHSYVVGQPTITALLAGPSRWGWPAAARAGHALACGLAVVAFAGACGRWSRGAASGLVAGTVAVLAARAPLHFWSWGGAPNVLGLAFAVAAVGAGLDVVREEGDRARHLGACALYSAAALLTHATSAAALLWVLTPIGLAACWLREPLRPGVLALPLAAAGAAVLAAPWLWSLEPVLEAGTIAWVRRAALESVHGTLAGALRLAPATLHDLPLIAGAAAVAALLWLRPRQLLFPLALALLLLALMLETVFFLLPGSALLYPDRIAALLLLPLALLAHDAARALAATRLRALRWPAAILLVAHVLVLRSRSLRNGQGHVLATAQDLVAIRALDAEFPRGCAVVNDYGDAGQWIPALLGRPITEPQVNVLFFSEVSEEIHPCAAFRGEVRPYGGDRIAAFCAAHGCEQKLREGEARVFRVADPAAMVRVTGAR